MDETIAITANPVRDRILTLYLDICKTSAHLQNVIVSKAPGNKLMMYKEFRAEVFELYNLSHRYEKLNKSILKEVYDWIKTPMSKPKDSFIIQSIELADKYIGELKRVEQIRM
jgi:hypothetical protein